MGNSAGDRPPKPKCQFAVLGFYLGIAAFAAWLLANRAPDRDVAALSASGKVIIALGAIAAACSLLGILVIIRGRGGLSGVARALVGIGLGLIPAASTLYQTLSWAPPRARPMVAGAGGERVPQPPLALLTRTDGRWKALYAGQDGQEDLVVHDKLHAPAGRDVVVQLESSHAALQFQQWLQKVVDRSAGQEDAFVWFRAKQPGMFGQVEGPMNLRLLVYDPAYFQQWLGQNRQPPPAVEAGPVITNSIGMQLARIPAGEFLMGSDEAAKAVARAFASKPEKFAHEHPQHTIRITRPFYMGVHEVTVGQFREFVRATNYRTAAEQDRQGGTGYNTQTGKFEETPRFNWSDPGFAQDDSHPVLNVTWYDAVAFCDWLSRAEGKTYRLPTEAEWEYACRAGTRSRYYNGEDPEDLVRVANVADAAMRRKFPKWTTLEGDDGFVFTAPVGSLRPNAFGLYDMHGNAWEWCRDRYAENYYASSPMADPPGPETGEKRVTRGGSWYSKVPANVRSAARNSNPPDFRDDGTGFRVVLESE